MTSYAPVPERLFYARRVVENLAKFLHAPDEIRLHIADDGSPFEEDFKALALHADLSRRGWKRGSFSNAGRSGIGGSLNLAMREQVRPNDYWLYITDDWLLTKPLDITVAYRLLRERGYDYVRLGPIHPNIRCTTRFEVDFGYYLELHPEYGGFAFATRPFLATRKFYDKIGGFTEKANAYEAERLYSEKVTAKALDLKLGFVADLNCGWEHIGDYNVGQITPD